MVENTELNLLTQLFKFVGKHGIDKTISHLSEKDNNAPVVLPNDYANIVVKEVTDVFQLTIRDLLYGKYARGETKFAIGFCAYYLYKSMSIQEIRNMVFPTRDKSIVSKYRNIIENLNPKYKNDFKYIAIKETLDKKLK